MEDTESWPNTEISESLCSTSGPKLREKKIVHAMFSPHAGEERDGLEVYLRGGHDDPCSPPHAGEERDGLEVYLRGGHDDPCSPHMQGRRGDGLEVHFRGGHDDPCSCHRQGC